MTTNRKHKKSVDTEDTGGAKKWLMYGGLAIAAYYGMRKLPFLQKLVTPLLAGAATKYFGGLRTAVQRS